MDGWITDSRDTVWAPDYADFSNNNSSNDNNSDWVLIEVEDEDVNDTPFDVEEYLEYTFVDPDQHAALERIQFLYRES